MSAAGVHPRKEVADGRERGIPVEHARIAVERAMARDEVREAVHNETEALEFAIARHVELWPIADHSDTVFGIASKATNKKTKTSDA